MIQLLKYDLKRSVISCNFVLSILVLLILIFSTNAVVINTNVPQYSVIEFIIRTNRDIWLENSSYSSIEMFRIGFANQWIGLFLPLIVSFPCIPMLCDEYNSKYWRYCLCRTKKREYIISKFICSIINSALIIIICYSLFACVCFRVFPSPNEYNISDHMIPWYERYEFNKLFSTDSILVFFIGKIITASVIASISGIFCLVISSITMNKYQALGIPVLFYFFMAQVSKSITSTYYQNDYGRIKYNYRYLFLDNSIRFEQIDFRFSDYIGKPIAYFFLYGIIIMFASYVAYYSIMKWRLSQ